MILGIDTSCYTTSFALVGEDGRPDRGKKRILAVPEGSRGLAQSAALFQHVRYGMELFRPLCQDLPEPIRGVCASVRPRNQADSYMPVFLVAKQWGELLSTAWQVPFYEVSHQENHLMAAVQTSGLGEKYPACLPGGALLGADQSAACLLGAAQKMAGDDAGQGGNARIFDGGALPGGKQSLSRLPGGALLEERAAASLDGGQPFLAVHLSGGTSEVLWVQPTAVGFEVTIVAATLDLAAGQLVDRVGVALGLQFPAGPVLDQLACRHQGDRPVLKPFHRGLDFSFSGAETAAGRLAAAGANPGALAAAVFTCIAETLAKTFRLAISQTGCAQILLAGGVAGSQYLKTALSQRLAGAAELFFTPPEYAADHAWGAAWLGLVGRQRELLLK